MNKRLNQILFFIPVIGFFFKLRYEWISETKDLYIPKPMRTCIKIATVYQMVCAFLFGRFIIAPLAYSLMTN